MAYRGYICCSPVWSQLNLKHYVQTKQKHLSSNLQWSRFVDGCLKCQNRHAACTNVSMHTISNLLWSRFGRECFKCLIYPAVFCSVQKHAVSNLRWSRFAIACFALPSSLADCSSVQMHFSSNLWICENRQQRFRGERRGHADGHALKAFTVVAPALIDHHCNCAPKDDWQKQITSPIVSQRLAFIRNHLPGGCSQGFSWRDAVQQAACNEIRVATWNLDSLRTSAEQAAAYGFDIMAIQELHVDKSTSLGIGARLKRNGMQLVASLLPEYLGKSKKDILNAQIPGVGFLVKNTIQHRKVDIPALLKWENAGRACAIQAFLHGMWITFVTVYAKQGDPEPLLSDLNAYAAENSHLPMFILGDFNQDTQGGRSVLQFGRDAWLPLTLNTGHDFYTFRRNDSTTVIDTIIVSPTLLDFCSPIRKHSSFKSGHEVLSCSIQVSSASCGVLEPFPADTLSVDAVSQDEIWLHAKPSICQPHLTSQQSWEKWAETLSNDFGGKHPKLGRDPVFRIKDSAKLAKNIVQLQQAMHDKDDVAVASCKGKIQKIQKNEIRKWKKRMSPNSNQHHVWIRNLFQWLKPKSIPVPSCLESLAYGCNGYTTSIRESLYEIRDFLKRLYCTEDAVQSATESPAHDPNHQYQQEIVQSLTPILAKLDVHKTHGIDGITVLHFKKLCKPAVEALAYIFDKILQTGDIPEDWLNCRVACIPKQEGKVAVKDLRPLSVAPVAWRIFSKWLLLQNLHCQNAIATRSVGGVKNRSGMSAWLPAAIACEQTWRHVEKGYKSLQGAAIDTAKFFDCIRFEHAAEGLAYIGFPSHAIKAWVHGVRRMKRYPSLNGGILSTPIQCGRGIPQGDPLSMVVAAAVLGRWVDDLPRELTISHVFVDDRLLIDSSSAALQELFDLTQRWDRDHYFDTKPKTRAFGTNPPAENLKWNAHTEVLRNNGNIVYLGIPLPFANLGRASFFEPIIDKLCDALQKCTRAHLSIKQSEQVVYSKIAPTLAYTCMVARPTQAQTHKLRTAIFKACAGRHFATQDAQALLLHKTHLFEPIAIMVYFSLCAWRRAFNIPGMAQQVSSLISEPSRRRMQGKGPITLLNEDLKWIGCSFDANTGALQHDGIGATCTFYETNKGVFQHFIRQCIRHRLSKDLAAKHERWKGIEKIDIKQTTALYRKMLPSQNGRVALARLLSNAHATPHRLYKTNAHCTPACRYCSCPDADVIHIAFQCPRFHFIRADWPAVLEGWEQWPPCAQHCLVATTELPQHVLSQWGSVQLHVALLFETWMSFEREPCSIDTITAHSHLLDCQRQTDAPVCYADMKQSKVNCQQEKCLDLTWTPPKSLTELHFWGATKFDYDRLFSFWKKWTLHEYEGRVSMNNWMQVLLVFLQMQGDKAPFTHRCGNIANLVWKFRTLSMSLLEKAWMENFPFEDLQLDEQVDVHWHEKLPNARKFTPKLALPCGWDVKELCLQLMHQHSLCAARKNMTTRHHLLTVEELAALIRYRPDPLPETTFGVKWITQTRRKRRWLTWEQQALDISQQQTCTSLADFTLQEWQQMDVAQIKSTFVPACAVKRQFRGKLKFLLNIKASLENNQNFAEVEGHHLSHTARPDWGDELPVCIFCQTPINFIKCADKLLRRCTKARQLEPDVICNLLKQADETIHGIQQVLAKF